MTAYLLGLATLPGLALLLVVILAGQTVPMVPLPDWLVR